MNRIFSGLIVVASVLSSNQMVRAQDYHNFSQFYLNPSLINPAYTGIDGQPAAFLAYKRQWMGITGAPSVSALSIQKPFPSRVGLGFNFGNDSKGVLNTTSVSLSGSYNIPVAKDQFVRFGLSIGSAWTKVDVNNLNFATTGDDVMSDLLSSNFQLLGSAGVSYHSKTFQIGASIPNIFQPNYLAKDAFSVNKVKPFESFILQGSYRFYFSRDQYAFEPYLLYRLNTTLPSQLEAAGVLHLKNIAWVGASYKQNFGISSQLGFKLTKMFGLGYSYTFKNTGTNQLARPSMEIQLGLLFGVHPKKGAPVYSFVNTEKERGKNQTTAQKQAYYARNNPKNNKNLTPGNKNQTQNTSPGSSRLRTDTTDPVNQATNTNQSRRTDPATNVVTPTNTQPTNSGNQQTTQTNTSQTQTTSNPANTTTQTGNNTTQNNTTTNQTRPNNTTTQTGNTTQNNTAANQNRTNTGTTNPTNSNPANTATQTGNTTQNNTAANQNRTNTGTTNPANTNPANTTTQTGNTTQNTTAANQNRTNTGTTNSANTNPTNTATQTGNNTTQNNTTQNQTGTNTGTTNPTNTNPANTATQTGNTTQSNVATNQTRTNSGTTTPNTNQTNTTNPSGNNTTNNITQNNATSSQNQTATTNPANTGTNADPNAPPMRQSDVEASHVIERPDRFASHEDSLQHHEELEKIDRLAQHNEDPTAEHTGEEGAHKERHEFYLRGDHASELDLGTYIIIGAFRAEANAKHVTQEYRKMGFTDVDYGYLSAKNVWYIHFAGFDDVGEAQTKRNKYRKMKLFKDAWLLTVHQ